MATTIIMPKLGNTVESSVIISWHVKPGDHIDKDSILCEIETDKATMEVPAGVEGTVLALLHKEGDDVPVLEPIAMIGEPEEDWQKDSEAGQASAAEETPAAQATATSVVSSAGGADKHASPRARQAMARLNVGIDSIARGSGPEGRILERDVIAASTEANAAPSAAETAAPKAETPKVETPAVGAAPLASDLEALGPFTDTPIKSIRKIIAERMMQSLQSSAQVTFNTSAPAERLLALRTRLKNSDPALGLSGVTVGDLVGFAAIRVLAKYPRINAHVLDTTIRSFAHVHLGLAVDTPRGLMVPVVRYADTLSLRRFPRNRSASQKAVWKGRSPPMSFRARPSL